MSDTGYEALAVAIIKQWATDYRNVVNKIMRNKCGDNKVPRNEYYMLTKESEWFRDLGLEEPDEVRKELRKDIYKRRKKRVKAIVKRQEGSY